MMTPQQPSTEDVRRDLQATLAARRELGPEYDDHFLTSLVEKLTAQVRQEVAHAPRAPQLSNRLSSDQRTGIAICSLIFGIPILAIAGGVGGVPLAIAALVTLVAVNLLAAR